MQKVDSRIRVLVANQNAEVEENLVKILSTSEYPKLEAYPAQIWNCSKNGKRLTDWLSNQVKNYRCHIVIVDKFVVGNNEDSHQALRDAVKPARCILLAGTTIGTERAMLAFLSNIGLLACRKGIFTLNNISPLVTLSERFVKEQRSANLLIKPLQPQQFNKALEKARLSSIEVKELLECLFPHAKRLLIALFDNSSSLSTVPRIRTVLLRVYEDNRLAVVVKLAQRDKIENEALNYEKYIRGQIQGLRHARLEKYEMLWSVGAAIYSFVGTEQGRLKSFSEYYTDDYDSETLPKILTNIFEHAWARQYLHAQFQPNIRSIFEQYDEIWSHKLSNRLPLFKNKERNIEFPGINGSLPNPVLWILDKKDSLIIRDARTAITHGDLHGDNLLVEEEHGYCWVIDFERSGPGPILRDFIELELDIITRLIDFPYDDLSLLYEFGIALSRPKKPSESISETPGIIDNYETNKALNVIEIIRTLAHKMTRYIDIREYLGGLLLNAVFLVTMLSEDEPSYMRALLLASILCGRLDKWTDLDRPPKEWPPKNWPAYDSPPENSETINNANFSSSLSSDMLGTKFVKLCQSLTNLFDKNELQILCNELSVDPDQIGYTPSIEELAKKIVLFFEQEHRLGELMAYVKKEHPTFQWDDSI